MRQYYASTSPEITEIEIEHSNFVRSVAGECMVLLENDGTLPLSAPHRIALYGNGARATVKGGTGSGDVNSRYVVNVEEGLEAAGFTIATKNWLDEQDKAIAEERTAYMESVYRRSEERGVSTFFITFNEHFIPKALAPFEKADAETAIYVLARNSGEGSDRNTAEGDYALSGEEITLLTQLGQHYSRVIVLLNLGGIIDVAALKAIPGINSILLIGQTGNMGGHIVADVLLGKSIPSGRLTDTWAANYWDYPSSAGFSHNNGNWNDEYYQDGIYVGYRYFDTFGIEPIYPFGYGLNYTSFSMKTLQVQADEVRIRVTAEVINTGSFPGREVVQIYGSPPKEGLEKPWQMLAGFGKTRLLQPGDSQCLTISFPLSNLESFDPKQAAYVLEAGEYVIRIGTHSRSTTVAAILQLDATAVIRKVKNICKPDEVFEQISSIGAASYTYPEEYKQKAAAPVIPLSAKKIATAIVEYADEPVPFNPAPTEHVITLADVDSGTYTLEQLVAQLTVEEMADLCVGAARDNDSVIGAASLAVPGAAGETSQLLAYRGIRDMTSADGPAGLRLMSHFRTDREGTLLPGGLPMAGMEGGYADKQEGEIDYYQYCTAIPIAWTLASSWDLEMIEKVGSMVGEEMSRFGVRIWLAPGMNIHRNPLCGRNFEYFSEDPLLSGLCGAADVRGVQHHPGIGASIKHYFANNQEDNRMYVNAHIGERAIREIYLRNFGICIQASQPMTIMTSYNLINGVHGANSYDALTCYAREECGFAGYIMSDWFTSNEKIAASLSKSDRCYPCTSSPLCILAGNDIQMPGCEGNIQDILDAVANGSLPVAYLQQCCARILRINRKCASFPDADSYAKGRTLTTFVAVE